MIELILHNQHNILLLKTLIIIFLCFFCNQISSDDSRDQYNNRLKHGLSFGCPLIKNASTTFLNNLDILFFDFNVKSAQTRFYSSNTSTRDTVYGYYMCRGDITLHLCNTCILNGTQFASKSSCKVVDGHFHSENCTFSYSDRSQYGQLENSSAFSFDYVESTVSNRKQFNQTLSSVIAAVTNDAAFGNSSTFTGFAVAAKGTGTQDGTVYSMAQCTPDILGHNCSKCLGYSYMTLQKYANGSPGGVVYMDKCMLRYDNVSFYDVEGNVGKGLRVNFIGVYSSLLLFLGYIILY